MINSIMGTDVIRNYNNFALKLDLPSVYVHRETVSTCSTVCNISEKRYVAGVIKFVEAAPIT